MSESSQQMHVVHAADFTTWRDQARQLLQARIPPSRVTWQDGTNAHEDLFAAPAAGGRRLATGHPGARLILTRDQLLLLERAARYRPRHGEQGRWSLIYTIVWRLAQSDPAAAHPADEDGRVLHQRWHAVKREAHHMHAFLRFHRAAPASGGPSNDSTTERYLAWFEPAHDVLDLGAEHFADRLGGAHFRIATPDGGVDWNGRAFDYRFPCPAGWRREAREAAAADDDHELWRTYFASTFNPARLNHKVMTQHMPQRFWRHLSEGDLIPALEARARFGGQGLAQDASVGRRQGKSLNPKVRYDSPTTPNHKKKR
ncbi:TIGR03915 family putative DNA repair protein [Salinicola rhizosphaerae]|uniref:DUF4130 domain-containing protein n=1 Tax=Salinicola rhizosphaerae TaxID=1443141 RepID=A0ABQ3E751_9GAMM|nr:TIGR03915 family putative DNA repair protein [Salinicola rhizosphaerae]GHB24637.1 hypothetical protein GCM10009038_24650 [Salinicola rhizosphaerae]